MFWSRTSAPSFDHDDVDVQLGAFARGAGREPYAVDAMVGGRRLLRRSKPAEVPIAINGLLPGEPARPEWMRVKADISSQGLPRAAAPDAEQGAQHRLRGGGLPQHLRVLGIGNRHPDAAR